MPRPGTSSSREAPRSSDADLAARAAAVDPESLMMICYTSGTTDRPKGVMHSHRPIRNTHERAQLFGYTATTCT